MSVAYGKWREAARATPPDRAAGVAAGPAQGMPPLPRPLPPRRPLAAPDERGRIGVPARHLRRPARPSPPAALVGCCPSSARRTRMRCTDSARFSHDPPSGVKQRPDAPRHQPVDQRRGAVPGQIVPDQQQPHRRQLGQPGRGIALAPPPGAPPGDRARSDRAAAASARMRAPLPAAARGGARRSGRAPPAAARTSPVAGRNSVSSLAVPPRTYSCGRWAGSPIGCQEAPGCGIAW